MELCRPVQQLPSTLSEHLHVVIQLIFLVQRTNAPWGIARLDQNAKLTSQNTGAVNFAYSYDSSAGAGVDIYIVGVYCLERHSNPINLTFSTDTGIYTQNADFGGRARWGATFGGYANAE